MTSEYDRIRTAEKIQEAKGDRGEWTGHYANRGPYEESQRRRAENDRFWDGLASKSSSNNSSVARPRVGRTGPGMFAWLDGKLAPEVRDRSFASLVGVIVAGCLFWVAYRRGFGDSYWDFIVPIGGGVVSAWLLRSVPFVARPLRWIAVVIVWLVLIGVACVVLVGLFST